MELKKNSGLNKEEKSEEGRTDRQVMQENIQTHSNETFHDL